MKSWLRRLRGVLGFGTLWGVAGAVFSPIFGLVLLVMGRSPSGYSLLEFLTPFVLRGACTGFVLGCGFAGVFTVIERRRTLEELSPARSAVWAAIIAAGLLLAYYLTFYGPQAIVILLTETPLTLLVPSSIFGVLGGSLAAGTALSAKRAPPELDLAP